MHIKHNWLVRLSQAIKITPSLLGLAAEALKCSTFEDFFKAFAGEIKHGTYWHITDNPNFVIDPQKGPRDLSSMSTSNRQDAGKLMITSHLDNWIPYFSNRPYAALIDMSQVPANAYYQVNRGFGNEFFVSDPSKAKVLATYPIAKARRINMYRHKQLPQSMDQLQKFYEQVRAMRLNNNSVQDPIPTDASLSKNIV